MLGTIPTLPASETYQKHAFLMKQGSKNEKLHATLDSQVTYFFMKKMQNVNWHNTSTDLRCKRHILNAPKYDK